jgi:HD-GYP domain-containing protein (c-di-GMP phosphodiesterase class II)/HAMP domain-containing protein
LAGLPSIKDSDFLRSRVARRIFFLFVLCALVPLSTLAYISFSQVTAQLHTDATQRLRNASKGMGMALLERLLLLDSQLAMLGSSLAAQENPLDARPPDVLAERIGDRFRSLALISSTGKTIHLLGTAPPFFDLDDKQRKHLSNGKPLLRIIDGPSGQVRIMLARPATNAKRDIGFLYAELDPGQLWPTAAAGHLTEVFVLEEHQRLLFATNPGQAPLAKLRKAILLSQTRGSFKWEPNDETHIAGYWKLFLGPNFVAPSWIVVHSQADSAILLPLEEFRATFPLAILLSFLVVLFLSLTQIRRTLVPIELLRKAAIQITGKDFGARVSIQSNDEFRELGQTFNQMAEGIEAHISNMRTVSGIGTAISVETDTSQLMDRVLGAAKQVVKADAGILYLVNDEGRLELSLLSIDSIGLTRRDAGALALLPSPDTPGPHDNGSAAPPLASDRTINVSDIDACTDFDFSAYRRFDEHTGYSSSSFLSVPMKNHEDEIIGVLQLINAYDGTTDNVVPFSLDAQRVAESLSSQAAVALTKNRLVDAFRLLFEGLIDLLVTAVDEKSPYTGGHCRRVPVLTNMLADAVCRTKTGPLKDFSFTTKERYELNIAALLHDCGKVITPAHIVDKSTKLETIYDRINLVDTRFEVLKRDARIHCLLKQIDAIERGDLSARTEASTNYEQDIRQIEKDREFLQSCNIGGESMSEPRRERVRQIASFYRWVTPEGNTEPCLTDEEVYNLTIPKGTLTPEEREIIDYHIVATIRMLESLQYPRHLQRVPSIAGSHHERIDGKGYPHQLSRDEIPIQGRILGIADAFEALTAADRPYKERKGVSEALSLLEEMKKEGHIDPDLFEVFVKEKVYLKYALECLNPEEIDDALL